jgi:hypothetical protein
MTDQQTSSVTTGTIPEDPTPSSPVLDPVEGPPTPQK